MGVTMKCVRLMIAGLAVAVAAAVAPVVANADGQARTAAPIAQAPTSWSGLYFGVHTGFQWSNVNVENPAFPPGFSFDHDSFVVGGHIGIQHQFGAIVVGLEGSLTSA